MRFINSNGIRSDIWKYTLPWYLADSGKVSFSSFSPLGYFVRRGIKLEEVRMSTSVFTIELDKQVEVILSRLSENGQLDGTFSVNMRWLNTVTDVRNIIRQRTGIPHDRIDIFHGGKRLPKTICLYQIKVSSNILKLFYYCQSKDSVVDSWIHIVSPNPLDAKFLESLEDVRNGFALGIKPELALYGSGGTYFLNDCNRWNLLAFKPEDEEPFAENNPRNLQGITGHSGFRKGIKSGEGWKREVAAFLIDRQHLFSVPTTVQSHLRHPYFLQRCPRLKYKVGSLQYYVEDADLCSDWSPSKYSVFEVQKIAFLDMYLLNTDRNDANMLVQRRKNNVFTLVPIDHGYSLPDCLELTDMCWCWLDWKHMKEPWDPLLIEFASHLDITNDIRLLNESVGIRKVCLLLMRISGMLLKSGIIRGLLPKEISSFYIRGEKPSLLERIVQECVERVKLYLLARQVAITDDDGRSSSVVLVGHHREGIIRTMSTQSLSVLEYSEEPYRFPVDVEHRLIHDTDYRRLFFGVLEESLQFWISTILHKRVYESGVQL